MQRRAFGFLSNKPGNALRDGSAKPKEFTSMCRPSLAWLPG
jgi:hypothetical protein